MTPTTETASVTIQAQHKFTTEERENLTAILIRTMDDLEHLDAQLSSVKKDFNSRIERVELERDEAHRKLKDGFEMRETKAIVHFHTPARGRKTFINADTFEFIRDEPMSADDYHRPLPLDIPPPKVVEFQPKDATPEPLEEEGIPCGGCGFLVCACLTGEESPTACTPGGEDAGTTPLGEALDQASVFAECPVFALDCSKYDDAKLIKAFKGGMGRAGWPETCISLAMEQLKACDSRSQMEQFIRTHTHEPEAK